MNNKTKNVNIQNQNKNNSVVSKLVELYRLMCETKIVELQTNFEGYGIKIKRFSQKEKTNNQQNFVQQSTPFANVEETKIEQQSSYEEIISPLNGIFYRAPSPTSEPFINEGDTVSVGDVLCIIEAMKVMNEIKSDKRCKIIKVLCQNGENVSIGTKLFLVEPL